MNIKVGSSNYKLMKASSDAISNDFLCTEGITAYGLHDDVKKIIKISDEDASSEFTKQVFFHELTHAMLAETGDYDLCIDERFVEAVSKQIFYFFTNNNLEKIYNFLKV